MAQRPARTCGRPGCGGIVRDEVCTRCGPRSSGGWHHTESRQQRGYDAAWQKLRARFIARLRREAIERGLSLFPLCDFCGQPIERAADRHVDHVRPFRGLGDPLRLDPANLRLAHFRCHMTHTARAAGKPRDPSRPRG